MPEGVPTRNLTLQILWLLTHRRRFCADFASKLKPEFFGSNEARYLARIALDYFKKNGRPIPEVAFENAVQRDDDNDRLDQYGVSSKLILRLYDNLKPVKKKDEAYFKNETEAFINYQTVFNAIKEAEEALQEEGVAKAWEILDNARRGIVTSNVKTLKVFEDMQSAIELLGERESESAQVTSGLPKLDSLMGGGLRTGELACFIAPTGRGKTMWLCYVAAMAFMSGIEVVYYTLEIDRLDIWTRIMACASATDIDDIKLMSHGSGDPDYAERPKKGARNPKRKNPLDDDDAEVDEMPPDMKIKRLKRRMRLLGLEGTDIWVRDVPARNADVNYLLQDIADIRREGGDPRLVIIDYADRLRPRGQHSKKWEGEEEVYQDLASICKELDIAIWTASQAGRTALKRRLLTLDHIAGAFSKTWEATFVVAAGQAQAMRDKQRFTFFLAKARRTGAADKLLDVSYNFARSRFFDLYKPEDVEDDEAPAMGRINDDPDETEE